MPLLRVSVARANFYYSSGHPVLYCSFLCLLFSTLWTCNSKHLMKEGANQCISTWRSKPSRLLTQAPWLLRSERQKCRGSGLLHVAHWSMLAPISSSICNFKHLILYAHVGGVHLCHSTNMEIRGQLVRESSLLPQNGSRDQTGVSRLGAFTLWTISLVFIVPFLMLW